MDAEIREIVPVVSSDGLENKPCRTEAKSSWVFFLNSYLSHKDQHISDNKRAELHFCLRCSMSLTLLPTYYSVNLSNRSWTSDALFVLLAFMPQELRYIR